MKAADINVFVEKMIDEFIKDRAPAQIVALNTDDVESYTDEVISGIEKNFMGRLRDRAKELAETGAVEDTESWGWEV
jgi:DNA-binding ferritin-like protein (Dps family)